MFGKNVLNSINNEIVESNDEMNSNAEEANRYDIVEGNVGRKTSTENNSHRNVAVDELILEDRELNDRDYEKDYFEKEYVEDSEEEIEGQEDVSEENSEMLAAESTEEDFAIKEDDDDDDTLTLLQELQILEQDSKPANFYFPSNMNRRFIFEKSNNFLVLKEEMDKYQEEPVWVVVDESDSCGDRVPMPTTSAVVHETVKQGENEEPRHSRSVFTNKKSNILVSNNKRLEDFDEDEEEDNKARVYWTSAGLIKEKPAVSLLRLDEIPDSARPTLAKLNSEELLQISTKHESVTSVILENENPQHTESFDTRIQDTEINKMKKKNVQKKGFVKLWTNLWQSVKGKRKRSAE